MSWSDWRWSATRKRKEIDIARVEKDLCTTEARRHGEDKYEWICFDPLLCRSIQNARFCCFRLCISIRERRARNAVGFVANRGIENERRKILMQESQEMVERRAMKDEKLI